MLIAIFLVTATSAVLDRARAASGYPAYSSLNNGEEGSEGILRCADQARASILTVTFCHWIRSSASQSISSMPDPPCNRSNTRATRTWNCLKDWPKRAAA